MKKIINYLRIIALIAVIVINFSACSDDGSNSGPLDGTWVKTDNLAQLIFSGSHYTAQFNVGGWRDNEKGTFSLNSAKTKITFECTHLWDSITEELKEFTGTSDPQDISISGDSFTIDGDCFVGTWTKQ